MPLNDVLSLFAITLALVQESMAVFRAVSLWQVYIITDVTPNKLYAFCIP